MVNVSLDVVKAVVQLIDVCSKRGAFEGGELSTVGKIRDEILAAAQDELKAEQEAAEAAEAAEGTEASE
jgi:hypothetical protein